MDFANLFEKIDTNASKKAKDEIKAMIKNDGAFLKMKKKAKKSSDFVPDFLDYVYFAYNKQIDKLSTKYKMDYDEIAQIIIAL